MEIMKWVSAHVRQKRATEMHPYLWEQHLWPETYRRKKRMRENNHFKSTRTDRLGS